MEKRILRGFRDIYGAELRKIVRVEEAIRKVMKKSSLTEEIRLPILEQVDIFRRAVGEDSDIVSKEFYDFIDKGGRHICLRPEGTASCMRAYMEGGFRHSNVFMPKGFWYMGPMFRYERPQAGRYRQFSQFGYENFACSPAISIKNSLTISKKILFELNLLDKVSLNYNYLGTASDRSAYKIALLSYLSKHKDNFSDEQWQKVERNPLRLFDSKDEFIQDLLKNAPKLGDFISIQGEMRKAIKYFSSIGGLEDPSLVRGLDYYNGFVFEWKIKDTNKSQNTVCGGGQYDGLSRAMGYNVDVNATGFALGIERVAELLDDEPSPETKSITN